MQPLLPEEIKKINTAFSSSAAVVTTIRTEAITCRGARASEAM